MNTNLQGAHGGLLVTVGLVPDPTTPMYRGISPTGATPNQHWFSKARACLANQHWFSKARSPPLTLRTSFESGLVLPLGFRR